MKSLNQYIKEKLIINQRFDEKLIINKDYSDAGLSPKSFDELRKIIKNRYDKLGPGNKQNPIDFNDIDVSNIDSFCNDIGTGIFDNTFFKYIDISDWDVSNIKSMRNMFYSCEKLKSIGDISNWDVSSVTDMSQMFFGCASFNQDLSSWDVSSVTRMSRMFSGCHSFNKDISNWNVSNVMNWMYRMSMFDGCPIKEEYKPKFKQINIFK